MLMKSLLLVCLCWFPLEICPLARQGNVGEGRASLRKGRGRGTEKRTGNGDREDRLEKGRARVLREEKDQGWRRGETRETQKEEGRGKNNEEQERETWQEEQKKSEETKRWTAEMASWRNSLGQG